MDRKIAVTLAHPQKVRAIAESQKKTDVTDADMLAKLLKANLIPPAHYTPKEDRDIQELLRARGSFVGIKTQVKNKIHAILHKANIRDDEAYTDLFGKEGRQMLDRLAHQEPSKDGTRLGVHAAFVLAQYLSLLGNLEENVSDTSGDIKEVFGHDSQAQFLARLPGIGYYTATILSKEIGPITRFKTAKHLVGYAGLAPRVYQSGEHTRMGRIRQGNKYIRWVLLEAVPKAIKKDTTLRTFYQKILERKGHNKAKVATARKMLAQIWYLTTYKKEFVDPETGSPVFFSGRT